jgi:hypothetical protein
MIICGPLLRKVMSQDINKLANDKARSRIGIRLGDNMHAVGSQRILFDISGDLAYFNTASRAPKLNAARAGGVAFAKT